MTGSTCRIIIPRGSYFVMRAAGLRNNEFCLRGLTCKLGSMEFELAYSRRARFSGTAYKRKIPCGSSRGASELLNRRGRLLRSLRLSAT